MAEECKAVIGFTSYPNERLGLDSAEEYYNVTMMAWRAAQQCEDADEVIAGACHVIYPRCLMGYSLELCRRTCLGERRWLTAEFTGARRHTGLQVIAGCNSGPINSRFLLCCRWRERKVLWTGKVVLGIAVHAVAGRRLLRGSRKRRRLRKVRGHLRR